MATTKLISINDAIKQKIERLRKPIWAHPFDHIKLDIFPDGTCGPWLHLYAPFNKECNGRDPVDMLRFAAGDLDEKCLEPYTGPLPDSDEYKAEVAKFDGAMKL